MKINEHGVFRGDDSIAGRTQEDVYAALELPCFTPELRGGRRNGLTVEDIVTGEEAVRQLAGRHPETLIPRMPHEISVAELE